jgi:predicted class III extradiol MEMO1 family dioxygenase
VLPEKQLNSEIETWLSSVNPTQDGDGYYAPPIKGAKAIIAPHAGYSYSGQAAAWAYKAIDTTGMYVLLSRSLAPGADPSMDRRVMVVRGSSSSALRTMSGSMGVRYRLARSMLLLSGICRSICQVRL